MSIKLRQLNSLEFSSGWAVERCGVQDRVRQLRRDDIEHGSKGIRNEGVGRC